MTLLGRPIGDPVEDSSINTTGEAYAIPLSSATPFIPVTQVKVYCSAKCYVAFGNDGSVDAVADWNRAVQQAATEEVYTRSEVRDADVTYVWVAAATGTIAADISYFG